MEIDLRKLWKPAYDPYKKSLNAIQQARLLALLIMDLRKQVYDAVYSDANAFEHEQDFYAQVSDGNVHRVPRGFTDDIIRAMGFSDMGQIRHTRRLLRLPRIVWVLADECSWTESFIQRDLLINKDDDETIRLAMRQAQQEGCDLNQYQSAVPYMNLLDTSQHDESSPLLDDLLDVVIPQLSEKLHRLSSAERKIVINRLHKMLDDAEE